MRFMQFILCCSLLVVAVSGANAQMPDSLRTIDMENLRQQSYLSGACGIDCDSTTGTVLEHQVCANLELQRQDSLLQARIAPVVKELERSGRTGALEYFLLGQRLWERYRFAHCSASLFDDGSRMEMILFMECAAHLAENRRRELERLFGE